MREGEPRIYLLPNLMTAGNLFCGFTAILRIIEGALIQVNDPDAAVTFLYYHQAILLILGACHGAAAALYRCRQGAGRSDPGVLPSLNNS